jgi:hypothetical protein
VNENVRGLVGNRIPLHTPSKLANETNFDSDEAPPVIPLQNWARISLRFRQHGRHRVPVATIVERR